MHLVICFPYSFIASIFFVLGFIRIGIWRVQVIICLTHFAIYVPFSFVSSTFFVLGNTRIYILRVQVIIFFMHFVIFFLKSFISLIFSVLNSIRILTWWVQVMIHLTHFAISLALSLTVDHSFNVLSSFLFFFLFPLSFLCHSVLEYWFYGHRWSFV